MSTDEIRTLVMRFVEPWNLGNVEVFDELCAPEYTLHYEPENWTAGCSDLKQAVLDARKNAPDYQITVNEIIIEGDRVAYEWVMSRTENGTFIKTKGITILRIKNGKITEDHFVAADVKQGLTSA